MYKFNQKNINRPPKMTQAFGEIDDVYIETDDEFRILTIAMKKNYEGKEVKVLANSVVAKYGADYKKSFSEKFIMYYTGEDFRSSVDEEEKPEWRFSLRIFDGAIYYKLTSYKLIDDVNAYNARLCVENARELIEIEKQKRQEIIDL